MNKVKWPGLHLKSTDELLREQSKELIRGAGLEEGKLVKSKLNYYLAEYQRGQSSSTNS